MCDRDNQRIVLLETMCEKASRLRTALVLTGYDWLVRLHSGSWLPYVQPARFKAASVPTGYNWLVQLLSDKVET